MRASLSCLLSVVSTLLLAALLAPPAAGAAPEPAPEGAWTIDDILLQENAGGFELSPDGRWAVWVKTRMDKKKGERVSNLVLSRLGGQREEIPLTRGRDRHTAPQWSPDGKRIAFLSNRKRPEVGEDDSKDLAKTQLWLVDARGGEPWPLTKLDRTIRSFDWRSEGTIVYAAAETKSRREQQAAEGKDTSQLVEVAEETAPVRLFAVDVADGRVTRLTENDDWIEWVKVSPDGRWAASLHAQSLSFRYDHKTPALLELHDLRDGSSRRLLEGQRMLIGRAEWAPDSKGFYVVQQYSSHPVYFSATINLLHYVDAESATPAPVDLHWPNGLGSPEILPTLDGFLALLADGVRYRPARYTRSGSGWTKQDLSGSHTENLFDWALGHDGRTLVYEHSTPSRPTQWYQALLNGGTIEGSTDLTDLNPGFRDKPMHPARVERWKGARDEEVEGILYYPMEYEQGKKYPLFLSIHGGPTGTDMDRWDQSYAYPKLLLAQKGAFLLEVNYHGSSNYGLEWVESICCGNYYDLERVDLEKGVDHVIQLGLADRNRLASMGWSNGAILTSELITRSDRFKVASVGAGDVEWISDWGNVDFGASFDNYYFGAAPYEDPDLYVRKSPYFRLKDVTTPTILYTGTEDRNVPPSQSWSHFRVMQQVGKTPVRFVLFPGEPHGLQKYVHQRRKLEEDLAWFDEHLFGSAVPAPVLKKGSPLADRSRPGEPGPLRRPLRTAGQEDAAPGDRDLPGPARRPLRGDAGPVRGLRLEVLGPRRNRQLPGEWAHLRRRPGPTPPGSPPPPGSPGDFPAPRRRRSSTLRPPASDVGDTDPDTDENTLDYWAGYAPSPEDAARLRDQAAALGGEAPLLKEVGQFRGRGKGETVFDLGGNVAEWTVGADGAGVLAGGSADHPAGATGPSAKAGEPYRGLRVVATP